MSVLQLSRAQIIEAGLALAGRPDLTSEARLWLSMFLEEQYMNQDYPWLVKTSEALTVSQGLDFPCDYRNARSAYLLDSAGGQIPIEISDQADEYDAKRLGIGPSTTGQPLHIYANHQDKKFYFLPEPSSGFQLIVKYYHVPIIGVHDDTSDDDEIPTWGLPFSILVDFIKARAMEYDDDVRQDGAEQKVMQKVAQAKINNFDRRAGQNRLNFGKSFKKRFRVNGK